MTDTEKRQIQTMRSRGLSFGQIGKSMGMPSSTVKSFCRRNEVIPAADASPLCECCGKTIEQDPKRKHKRFCSDKCRLLWWKDNSDKLNRKALYEIVCVGCHKTFTAYGAAQRKYCSHGCYIKTRFGGAHE